MTIWVIWVHGPLGYRLALQTFANRTREHLKLQNIPKALPRYKTGEVVLIPKNPRYPYYRNPDRRSREPS